MHIDFMLNAFQLHIACLLFAAVTGLVTMFVGLRHTTLLSALVLFGGPLARMLVVTAFFLAVVFGFHGTVVNVLAYASVFLFCQLAGYFLGTMTGGKMSKRYTRELKLFLCASAIIATLSFIVPLGASTVAAAWMLKLWAAAGLYSYWKFAGMVLSDLGNIDNTARDTDK